MLTSDCQRFLVVVFFVIKTSKGFWSSATLLPPVTQGWGNGEEELPQGERLAHALWCHHCRRVTFLLLLQPRLLHLPQETTKRKGDVSGTSRPDCQTRETLCHFTLDSN